ncbi:hypothetical protein H2200_001683 [Cladophialophora chaetospira]|uniref:Uncharacterized protein n=1 Tax=Cladophialophora chaetospira TaxID=386627 RepID=A0AA39CN95_9EURO|nr:hypothetical protein H2200_001683 [Cladophialophora chaetospira]
MVGKCYTQLSNYLARADSTPDVALTCSVLFYSLESLLGQSRQAISHLDSGLTLLKRTRGDPKWMTDPLIVRLASLFERLDVQASTYDDERIPSLELVSPSETQGFISVVPGLFHDVNHAEQILAKLENWTLRQTISNVGLKGRAAKDVPSDLSAERLVLLRQFERYGDALNRLGMVLQHQSLDIQADKAAKDASRLQVQRYLRLQAQLRIFHYLMKEHMHVAPNASGGLVNAPVDGNETDLNIALSTILELLSLPNMSAAQSSNTVSPPASSSQRTYTLSGVLVAGLYFLCLKTTNQALLNTAYSLFSHPQLRDARDGLWDAHLAELVITNVINLRDRSTASSDNVQSRDSSFRTTDQGHEHPAPALVGVDGLKTPFSDHYAQIRPKCQTERTLRGANLQQPELSPGARERKPNRLEEFGFGVFDVEGGVEEAARRLSLIAL